MTVESYDELPYSSRVYHGTHPRQIAAIGKLLGLDVADIDGCRVLEIGCGTGGSLISCATSLPGGRFVGVDYSQHQIDIAQSVVEGLGIDNIEFLQKNILEIDVSFGEFDYIIAHGIYSWVPEEVKNKLMEVCKQNLSEKGVAYVSHNTYPGAYYLLKVRDMMLYHVRNITDTQERVDAARKFFSFMLESVPLSSTVQGAVLKKLRSVLDITDDSYLAHEYLDIFNEPVLFHKIADDAADLGLQYLGDADFIRRQFDEFPHDTWDSICSFGESVVEQEQYGDFVKDIMFRKTLFCHAGKPLNETIEQANMKGVYVSALSHFQEVVDNSAEKYKNDTGASIDIRHPVLRVVMRHLVNTRPMAASFDELCETVVQQKISLSDDVIDQLKIWLLRAYSNGFIELSADNPVPKLEVDNYPKASSFSRFQAKSGPDVINLCHQNARLNTFAMYLLPFLDGTENLEGLVNKMAHLQSEGVLEDIKFSASSVGKEGNREHLESEVSKNLNLMAKWALLVN